MNKNFKILGVIVLVTVLGAAGWFFTAKQSQKKMEVKNENQKEEKKVEKSKEQNNENNQEQNNEKKIEKKQENSQGCSGEMAKMFVDGDFLECSFCPKVGDSIIEWCDNNKEELRINHPDCDLFFCGRGGTNLGRNYKKYKGRIYFWDEEHGQAVWNASLMHVDQDTFQVLYENPIFDTRCMARDKKNGKFRYFYETEVYSDKKCGLTE
jgi:hypothetical protein